VCMCACVCVCVCVCVHVCVCQVKVDEFFEMVSTTVDTYAQLFCDGDMSTFSSSDEAHFVLALSGIVTSKYLSTTLSATYTVYV